MSSVLRALKKLERETYSASGMPGKTIVKTGHGFHLHVNPVWQHRLLMALVLLMLILTGFAAMFIGKSLLFPVDTIEPGATKRAFPETRQEAPVIHFEPSEMYSEPEGLSHEIVAIHPGPMVAESSDQNEAAQHSRAISTYPEAVPSEQGFVSPQDGPAPFPDEPVDRVSDKNGLRQQEMGDAGIPADIPEDDTTWRVINKDTVLPVESDPVPSRSSGAVSAPAAEDFPELDPSAGLTLQAISWSADPARRLAVINGRLCREGEPVDGYVLVRISTDDVLLSDGRISARLVFKIR